MNIKLGKSLLAIRKEANLSQQEIANIINCSRGTYSCWEHDDGEIPLSKLLTLLHHCNISLSAFIKKVQEDNNLPLTPILEPNKDEVVDIKAELTFISNRIAFLNQNLSA